ncbi:NUDIX domain-containing protein [Bizionia gelidisalsuginis]|uniref:GDP-mannose pyrophosphatase n=2 Tax=Bizionia TaxID=283785 RepID=A0A8H2QJ10_9FLAO|nr:MULTISPECIES: NUDIX domain-containing protein [Bizionia]TYB73092.1 NUDIX domain-containing protein [Bizionia saleffrena]TYC14862.1 NUDIX domain-containing protein [Bizionia gelidisalsuginis]
MTHKVKNVEIITLSNEWALLNRINFDFQFKNKEWRTVSREVYNRSDAACVLLYNSEKRTVILTAQFRMPAYLNTKNEGTSIEVCAGLIDGNEKPLECVLRETEEEVGYRLPTAIKIMEVYMSPGAITEKMHLFVAEYTPEMKINSGGGLEGENEEIAVLEMPFTEALQLLKDNSIRDAKTVILLQYVQLQNLI